MDTSMLCVHGGAQHRTEREPIWSAALTARRGAGVLNGAVSVAYDVPVERPGGAGGMLVGVHGEVSNGRNY